MYLPAAFREQRFEVLSGFVRAHPLGALVANTDEGLTANHVPMLLDGEEGHSRLRGHVARANTLWQRVAPDSQVLVLFTGAQHYISPNLYPTKRDTGEVVPTWNYSVVHAQGRIRWQPDKEWLRGLVGELTDEQERSQPKPWHITDAPPRYLDGMLAAIVGFEIQLDSLIGKVKASQNRVARDRTAVRESFEAAGVSSPVLDELVRDQ